MRRIAALITIAVVAAMLVAIGAPAIGGAVSVAAVLAAGWLMRSTAPARSAAERPAQTADAERATEPSSLWLEAMPCGVLLLDSDLTVVGANDAAVALCGRSRGEIEGVSLIRAIRDHNIAQITREGAGVAREVDVRDGQVVRVTATRLDEPIGRADRVLALEELTELRRAQRARSDLVANASHELRTPVTAALALAETLESGVEDEALRREFHSRLSKEVARLGGIVEGLLTLSRLEAQSDEFSIESLEVRELLETAARRIDPLLGGRSIAILDDAGASVDGDHERVLEVLANLLDNALRVTPDGGTVTLTALKAEDQVRFEVHDDGPGISPRDRSRVFERFYTGDESRSGGENSGLGLAIVRHIVSRLGGRVWVADRTPGTTLCFTLPVADADGEAGTTAELVDAPGASRSDQ